MRQGLRRQDFELLMLLLRFAAQVSPRVGRAERSVDGNLRVVDWRVAIQNVGTQNNRVDLRNNSFVAAKSSRGMKKQSTGELDLFASKMTNDTGKVGQRTKKSFLGGVEYTARVRPSNALFF